jgi:AcrR family transcriptional regulator
MRKPVYRRTHSEREQQIIDIASRSFRERGFEGVSLSDLAREAGVTRNLVYHYFPNKGALFEAVLDHRAEHLLERLPEPGGAEADKDLLALIEALVRLGDDCRAILRLSLGSPMRKQFLYAHTAWAKEKIEERLARALGLAPEDPSQKAVSAFTGMLLSFLMDNMSNELFRNREHEWAEYFVRILREMIERLPVTEPKPFQ